MSTKRRAAMTRSGPALVELIARQPIACPERLDALAQRVFEPLQTLELAFRQAVLAVERAVEHRSALDHVGNVQVESARDVERRLGRQEEPADVN